MAERKAAIQMSLGFIVAVVFAVVLLSLLLTWISSMLPTITDITYKVTDTARSQLLEKMSNSGDKVGIAAPPVTSWRRGETGSYAVGIRNVNSDTSLKAYLNVYLSQLGGDLAGRSVNDFDHVHDWLTYTKSPEFEIIDPSEQRTSDLIIRPDPSAAAGIYKFTVVVCEESDCTQKLESPNLYGYTTFALDIKQ